MRIGAIQKAVLGILEQGEILTFAALTSGRSVARILRNAKCEQNKRNRERIFNSVLTMKRNRLIDFKERNGEQQIILAKEGKKYALRYKVETLSLPRDASWDKKWRIIMFDIPERYGRARRALSAKLKDMGALQLQKSVFVYPFSCKDEIDFITEFFQISPYIRYTEATKIEGDDNLKHYFDI